jgi:transcriptional regulator with XRE-family HTH domain
MKLNKAISERIKELREASGLSQQEVAVRADLSLSLVAKLEQGKKADPRASTLLALARALSVPPGELINNLPVTTEEEAKEEAEGKKAKKKKKKGAKHKSKS